MTAPSALATIDGRAIERNCARLPKPLCAVVKSDGYGHGAGRRGSAGGRATWLAVAAAEEAAELRRQGIEAPMLVMGALTADELRAGGGRGRRRRGLDRGGRRGRRACT